MAKPVILCVDDEKIILSSLKSQLQHRFGTAYQVELAESGEEALELVDEYIEEGIAMPLIISDYIMGGMYGDELLAKVKQRCPNTLNVLLTGQANVEAVGEAVNKAGLFRYIAKPWDEHDFLLTVETALHSYQQLQVILSQTAYKEALSKVVLLVMTPNALQEQIDNALKSILTLPVFNSNNQAMVCLFASTGSHLFVQSSMGFDDDFVQSQIMKWAALDDQAQKLIRLERTQGNVFYSVPIIYHAAVLGVAFLSVSNSHNEDDLLTDFLTSLAHTLAGMVQLDLYTQALKLHSELLDERVKDRTLSLRQSLAEQERLNSELLHANNKLENLASIDSLTGLLNRRCFFELANQEVARAKRYERQMSLMMIDIDHFKPVNDRFGHAAGDDVLRQVSKLFVEVLRSADLIGRVGGEEFAVLMPESSLTKGLELAERLRALICAAPIQLENESLTVSVSIGVAEVLFQDNTVEEALKRADEALYTSKAAGRNNVS